MAIVRVDEVPEGNDGTFQMDRARRTYQRVFRAYSDDAEDGPGTAATAIPVEIGDTYASFGAGEADTGALCKQINAKRSSEDRLIWVVTASYDTDHPDPDANNPDPMARPVSYKLSCIKYSKPLLKDLNDDVIQNSAFIPFNPPVERDESRFQITVTVNRLSVDFPTYAATVDTVNYTTWHDFPAQTLRVVNLEVSPKTEHDLNFWEVTWTLETAPGLAPWNPVKILDQGQYVIDTGTGGWRQVRDAFGQPLDNVLLDGTGAQLAQGADPVYLEFQVYETSDFSLIP